MAQKLAQAHAMRDVAGVNRPIFVDALDGACHRAFGSMPNMSWIFTNTTYPIYKAGWTDARSIANSVDYYLDVRARRRAGERLAPFHAERLEYGRNDRQAVYKKLIDNGPKAVREHQAFHSKITQKSNQ